ncbi:hypothetical protein J2Z50_004905 [Ensifer mexicanus]|nr:hypothetical protein [Sinorhizobium mexicanum]
MGSIAGSRLSKARFMPAPNAGDHVHLWNALEAAMRVPLSRSSRDPWDRYLGGSGLFVGLDDFGVGKISDEDCAPRAFDRCDTTSVLDPPASRVLVIKPTVLAIWV